MQLFYIDSVTDNNWWNSS